MRVNRQGRLRTLAATVQAGTVLTGTVVALMRWWEEELWLDPEKTRPTRAHEVVRALRAFRNQG